MVRFGEVVLAYFLIGSMMWAGGLVGWHDAGVGSVLVSPSEYGAQANSSTGEQLEQASGPIQQAADTVSGGGLLAVWGLITGILNYLFWPVSVMVTVNAPAEVVVLMGGTFVMALFVGVIRLIRSSA